jgi:D-amino peptidase
MKVYIMTDLEGVAGVINFADWVCSDSKYYEDAKILLTEEVNAAIDGFFSAGATEILVADGHGYGGINLMKLDPRARMQRGFPDPYPFGLDETFDCICHIGQHAKASSEKAHICHTGSFDVIDHTINGVSIGEFGEMVYCANELKVPEIFATGDLAFTKEAEDLVEGIVTVAVKEGLAPGRGIEKTLEETVNRTDAAIHLHPLKARELIRNGAYIALKKFMENPESFKIKKPIQAPYELVTRFRASKNRPAFTSIRRHENSVIRLLNSRPEIKEGVDLSDLL